MPLQRHLAGQSKMKNPLLAIIIVLAVTVVGCRTTTVTPVSTVTTKTLTRGSVVYIVTPSDGSYGKEQYSGSGKAVATAFQGAFVRYADDVIIGATTDSATDAIAAARLKKCQYLVIPKITHWEDRATEWSGIRDKLVIFIKVISVEDGAEVRSVEVSGKSSWFTFGGDHPQDLIKSPIQKFVASLY